MRRFFVLLILLMVLPACSDEEGPAPPPAAIGIEGFAFAPDELRIAVGSTVTWTNNESDVSHTSTSDDGLWDSGTLQPGYTFSRTFGESGTFAYHCSIHPNMKGTVIVGD